MTQELYTRHSVVMLVIMFLLLVLWESETPQLAQLVRTPSLNKTRSQADLTSGSEPIFLPVFFIYFVY